jgi:hypothetical protein
MILTINNKVSRFRLLVERRLRRRVAPEAIVPSHPLDASAPASHLYFNQASLTAVVATFGIEGAAELISAGCRTSTKTGP